MSKKQLKFLVVAQDLRISGTSEGVVSRSFIGRLRQVYPTAVIDLVYLKNHTNNDRLDLLPVDNISEHYLSNNIPKLVIWSNKIWWRIRGSSLNDAFKIKKYRRIISKIEYKSYDHVFLRSSGQEYETIRASSELPLLEKAIINFHDPYPVFWDTGSNRSPRRIEFAQFEKIWRIVKKAKVCLSPSQILSQDLSNLYGSNKKFHVLPHQYLADVFEMGKEKLIRKRKKKISISYHGALQLGRNLDILIRAYLNLINEIPELRDKTEFVFRLRGVGIKKLREKYSDPNLNFLKPVDLATSIMEQEKESDILIILDNCSTHSNILPGKAPLLASFQKPVLALSPDRSEIRRILKNEKFSAKCDDMEEIQLKLERLIKQCLDGNCMDDPFKDYFGLNNFKKALEELLEP